MRWLRAWSLALALALSAPPALALGPMDGPGCIGVNIGECLRWLRATMVLNENSLVRAMAERHATDVNGRPLSGGLVTVYAKLPGEYDAFTILLRLRPDDTVQSAQANVKLNLLTARTEQLYDQSKFYDLAWRLIGRRCPALAKLELYRLFENQVKPRVTEQRKDYSGGINGLHQIVTRSSGVPMCGGVSLAYHMLTEWRGTKELEAAAKVTQTASFELQ